MSMALAFILTVLIGVQFLSPFDVCAKVCTDQLKDPLQSHTLRYEVLSSTNAKWRDEVLRRYSHRDTTSYGNDPLLLPTKRLMLKEEALHGATGFLRELSLHDVRLESDSLHGKAQTTNLEYLVWLDEERLVWSFRRTAGFLVRPPVIPYGGWEAPDTQLRGHFVGHYLSATALMWASTHNQIVKQKMTYVVSALKECQDKMGTGYLSAFPDEFFDRFEALERVWAPYYTIHKIMAGLLDQYTYAQNSQALDMVIWMAEYFNARVHKVIEKYTVERHYLTLNEEVGGMNDVLYRLYSITGNQNDFLLARLFDKPCFLGILAMQADHISGFHANTHIPLVVGAQTRYEVNGDELYREIGNFFMEIVNATHVYATGGTSSKKFWHDPKRLGDDLGNETEESCTTYNMLKVSRNLFRWTREVVYADYYERALTNGVLSIQRGEDPGIMIYMLPLGHGVSKARTFHGWGTKNNSFWCCYGTGIESFSKLGDSIYFEGSGSVPQLYLIQFIASSVNWKSGKITLTQKVSNVVSWDQRLQVTVIVSTRAGSGASTLNLRIPSWTYSRGAVSLLNEEKFALPKPGTFLSLTRSWKNGDEIKLELPLSLRSEAIEDDGNEYATLKAVLYGPYLLAGLSTSDYTIKSEEANWISPIPYTYNSRLISLFQGTFFLTRADQLLTMESTPAEGTDAVVHATFRLIVNGSHVRRGDPVGLLVKLEPFDLPGSVVAHNGSGQNLFISSNSRGAARFRILRGLDGRNGTVSLQPEGKENCYVFSSLASGSSVKLSCKPREKTGEFSTGASFEWRKGLRLYNSISFVAKGEGRNYVLEPLLSLKDESYNVYFNMI